MIADHLRAIRERINDAARRSGRDPQQVQLLAVSKTFPAEAVLEAAEGIFGQATHLPKPRERK